MFGLGNGKFLYTTLKEAYQGHLSKMNEEEAIKTLKIVMVGVRFTPHD